MCNVQFDPCKADRRGVYTSTVEFLISIEKVDPRADNDHCIITSIIKNFTEMVRLLVTDSRIDPSVHDNMAIPLVARQVGSKAVIEAFGEEVVTCTVGRKHTEAKWVLEGVKELEGFLGEFCDVVLEMTGVGVGGVEAGRKSLDALGGVGLGVVDVE
ncbi:hypothetical protein HDU79_000458 [Rhizoclosmatium sp. JEL0117]|nr:hypothetical protein HDU79_000458 [Rhizoclosmatium sp. JEL0117]